MTNLNLQKNVCKLGLEPIESVYGLLLKGQYYDAFAQNRL